MMAEETFSLIRRAQGGDTAAEERLLREIYLFEKRIPDVPGKRGTEKSSLRILPHSFCEKLT